MRRVLSIALLLAGCLHTQPPGTASVAGIVVDQAGAPMAGVHLRLMTGDFFDSDAAPALYGVTSDSAGKFSVDGLKPGLYMAMAQRAGYVQSGGESPMGLALIAVKAGQRLTEYKVVLTARAVIVGHVVDEYGDPVQGVNVQVEHVKGDRGQGEMFGGQNSLTDDRGEFRIITAPGKFYVKAEIDSMQFGGPEIRTDGTAGAPFTITYYPSAPDNSAASTVQVAAGQDLAGLEIRMLHKGASTTRTFTVSGTVSGLPENEHATVSLRFGEKPDELTNDNGTDTGNDGKFTFSGLVTGYYSLSASCFGGKTPLHSRAVKFHLESSDEAGLQLTLGPGEDLNGTLEILGAPTAEKEKHTVRLEAEGWGGQFGDGGPPAAEVEPNGAFHFHDVPPGRFKPVVEPMPDNRYLKDVMIDGKPVAEGVLDFSQGIGGSRLKLTVSRDGAQISGRVLDKDGEPVVGLVLVFFGNDAKHLDDGDAARVSDGHYSFKAIHPGKYRIFALDVAEMMQAFSGDGDNEDMMQQFFDSAEEIEIKEGDRITKDLTAKTKMPPKKEHP
jgi:Carboxypeptidase regulatory-like domain